MIYYKDNKFIKEDYIGKIILEKIEYKLTNKEELKINNEIEPIYKEEIIEYENVSYIHDKEEFEEIQLRVFNKKPEEVIYEDIIFSEEEIKRLEEVNEYGRIPEIHIGFVLEYVKTGEFMEGNNHPLREFQLEKEIMELRSMLSLLKTKDIK